MTKTTDNHTHIQFTDIVKHFGSRKHHNAVLKGATIELKGGQCVLLSGKNGSGKSTLLRILAGLLKPESATINTGLESYSWAKYRKTMRQKIMYLYQEPYMFDGTVAHNLGHALTGSRNTPANAQQIQQALQWASLSSHATTQAKCLSGGEKQRVALAQAWLRQPSVLLLDEPTANMDDRSRYRTDELLSRFKDCGTALLIASHDHYHFNQTMDTRLLLDNGVISEPSADQQQVSDISEKNVVLFKNPNAE